MMETVPLSVDGREIKLRLDLRAMMEAEKACPGLKLLSTGGKGWGRVAEEASALIALVYGCSWMDRKRGLSDPVDTAYLEWLASSIGPDQLHDIQLRIAVLYATAISVDDDEERGNEQPDGNPPGAGQSERSTGMTSGHSGDSASDSQSASSGPAQSDRSTSSQVGTETSKADEITEQESSPPQSRPSSPESQ